MRNIGSRLLRGFLLLILLMGSGSAVAGEQDKVRIKGLSLSQFMDTVYLQFRIETSQGAIRANEALRVTPVVESESGELCLPFLLVNGRLRASYYERERRFQGELEHVQCTPLAVVTQWWGGETLDYRYAFRLDSLSDGGRLVIRLEAERCGTLEALSSIVASDEPLFVNTVAMGDAVRMLDVESSVSYIRPRYDSEGLERISGATAGGQDDNRLVELFDNQPYRLALSDMYRVAQRREGRDFLRVFEVAVRYYPHDETAIVNASSAALIAGNLDRARALLESVADNALSFNNFGVYYLMRDMVLTAREYFKKAQDADIDAERDRVMLNMAHTEELILSKSLRGKRDRVYDVNPALQ